MKYCFLLLDLVSFLLSDSACLTLPDPQKSSSAFLSFPVEEPVWRGLQWLRDCGCGWKQVQHAAAAAGGSRGGL